MTRNIFKNTLTTTALIAMSMAGFSAANAQTPEARTAIVHYGDLDLSNELGKATLNKRIKAAVIKVCGRPSARDLNVYRSYRNCVTVANNSARIPTVTMMPDAVAAGDAGQLTIAVGN